jgi:hypothetical protein
VQGPSDDAKIDVSHESFIRTWQTFRDWLAEERNLAGAFIDLKKDYVHRQERYADQAQPLFRRLMSRLGRLSDDRIKASEGWWHNRKNNSAWAERYKFSNLDREQIGTPHRGFLLEHEPSLQELRRYRWRSTLQSSVRSYLPIGALGAVAIAALGWGVTQYNYSQALLKTQWERTQSMAYGIESRVSERVVDSTHPARLWETLVAVESFLELDHRRRQPRSPISNWFRSVSSWLTDSELTSGLYSQAVHRAARRVMYATIWPRLDIVAPRDGDKEPALNTEIPKACGENFKNVPESVMQTYKERTGTGPDAILHQVTDFRNGGNEDRIALVTTSSADSTALHLIAIRLSQPDGASQRCDVEYIFQVPVGPGNVKIDGELRFIVVNWELRPSPTVTTRSDAPVQVAWLARLGWLRDCSGNLTDDWKCADGTAYTFDGDNIPLTIPIGGPYSITAEGFVKDNFGQYWEVQFDDKPRLLTPKETSQQANKISATRASLSIESGGKNLSREQLAVFCNQSDRHLAILKERPRSWARQYRLQVFELGSEHDKTKCGPNSPYLKGESAGSLFELQFSAPPLVDVSFDQDDRSSVVVHSAVGVMHRISWDLRRFHKRLCTSLRSQRDQITEALKGGLPSEWQALSPELSRAFKEKDNLVHKLQLPLCAEGTDDRWTPARGAAPSARPSTR